MTEQEAQQWNYHEGHTPDVDPDPQDAYFKCAHCDYRGLDVEWVTDGSENGDYWCAQCWFADYSGE